MPIEILRENVEAPASPGAFASGDAAGASGEGAEVLDLRLTPHSSLSGRGFAWAIGVFYAGLCVPLVGLVGTVALWGVLPFGLAAMATLWLALRRSWRDRDIEERFRVTPTLARLDRREPDGTTRDWEANPYWVRVEMTARGPVEKYLTLEGGPRRVEIGAFLTPGEREALRDTVMRALAATRQGAGT